MMQSGETELVPSAEFSAVAIPNELPIAVEDEALGPYKARCGLLEVGGELVFVAVTRRLNAQENVPFSDATVSYVKNTLLPHKKVQEAIQGKKFRTPADDNEHRRILLTHSFSYDPH